MPSSVLFALVVAAGVLLLMPALAHRYDAALRAQDELLDSPMRVLVRRRPTVTPMAAPVSAPMSATPVQGRPTGRVRVRRVPATAGATAGPGLPARPVTAVPLPAGSVSGGSVPAGSVPAGAVPISVVRGRRPALTQAARAARAAAQAEASARRRAARRRLLVALGGLVGAQLVAGAVFGPAFWAGAAVSAAAGSVLVLRSRTLAARQRAAVERAEQDRLLVARARQHRAEAFVRRTLRSVPAGAEREAWLGESAVRSTARWLSLPRVDRTRPARDVVRVLAAARREAYLAADGSWAVRPVVRPGAGAAPAAAARKTRPVAAEQTRPVAAEPTLPRVVNG